MEKRAEILYNGRNSMGLIKLDDPVSRIKSVGDRWTTKLKNLGIETIRDLLYHFPVRYEDFSEMYKIGDLIPRQEATIQGIVEEIDSRRSWKRNLLITEATISDDSGSIRAVWFNQPYIKTILRPGTLANFSGRVSGSGEIPRTDGVNAGGYLSNPTYEPIRNEEVATKHTARIVPVYPETKGLTSKGLRNMVTIALENLVKIPEPIPLPILNGENLPGINQAIQNIHFPPKLDDATDAKRRFAFENLFLLQVYNLKQKIHLARSASIDLPTDLPYVKSLVDRLPFPLTFSQKKSLWEILKDTGKKTPMNRLLQGDVGSGKTVVAAIAALNAVKAGHQVAFMAPTSILAAQHYNTFLRLFGDFTGGVALVTSGESEVFYGHDLTSKVSKQQVIGEIKRNKIKIAIGTHALIQKEVNFPDVALVIVDEQHRFGVKQRDELLKNKSAGLVPHFLSMSATPIPRTLSLTLFGDLDLSVISEMPKNRKKIITKVVTPEERKNTYAFIRDEIKSGRQTFVICPRIDKPDETPDILWQVKAVKEEYRKLSQDIFPDLKTAMLHGKMKMNEKEKTMKDFLDRKIDILVSTSVIEVGIDVPNASIIMIEGADRFGLAQLYQFRGRVGRGEHQSYCFLLTDSESKKANQRLKTIEKAKSGFELAEYDLKMRGPGEFLGQSQTGMPDLAMKALQNPDLIKRTRELAFETLKEDVHLKKYPALRVRLSLFEKNIHWE